MKPRRVHSAMIWFVATAGFAVGYAAAAAAQAPTTLRYAVDTERNINELSQRVAERQGFFAREGLNLEIHRFVATGDRESDRTSLVGARSSFDMARMQLSALMEPEGRFKGMSYVAVEAVVNNPVYFLVARPEIKTFADLKGKTLTLPSPSDPISLTAHELLKAHGLDDGDVRIKDIAARSCQIPLLRKGSIGNRPIAYSITSSEHAQCRDRASFQPLGQREQAAST